ncbi:MAG: CpsD/CapB family tyrosine-protein kinase [Negativicutes bacterium]|nr:CpsD/CapB family tyrosine-protein kinase [Negativicutes bacterium]
MIKLFNRALKKKDRHSKQPLIVASAPKSIPSEAYRVLRTNLHYAEADRELKTILFTSAGPGEGKSTVSANVALAFAQDGKRVLLVDCDLRKPTVATSFGISKSPGLTNILVENINWRDCVARTEFSANLEAIPCGPIPPNPSEILGSGKMLRFIEEVKGEFDLVVFDAPPVIAVTDACVLAGKVDGVVLVLRAEVVRPEMAQKAKALLDTAKASILGAVINDINVHEKHHYYYYYYYYYGQSRQEKPKKGWKGLVGL